MAPAMRPASYETALEAYAELEDRTGPGDLEAVGDFPRVPLALLMHDPEVMIGQFVKLARLPRADTVRVEALWGGAAARSAATRQQASDRAIVPNAPVRKGLWAAVASRQRM